MKSFKKLAPALGALAIASVGTLFAQTTVVTTLIEDDFNRTGNLYGTHPSGGTMADSVTWQGYNGSSLYTNGSVLQANSTSNQADFIPLTMEVDSGIYTLSATMTLTARDIISSTSGLYFGLVNEAGITTTGGNIGSFNSQGVGGWLFRWLPTGNELLTRVGSAGVLTGTTDTGLISATAITFYIVIDTSSENLGNDNVTLYNSLGLATTYLDYTEADLAKIAGLKLGHQGVTGTFENLLVTVETTIPEPAAVALILPLFMLGYAFVRRRK